MKGNKRLLRSSIMGLLGVVMVGSSSWAANEATPGPSGSTAPVVTTASTSAVTASPQSLVSTVPVPAASVPVSKDSLAVIGAMGPIGAHEVAVMGLDKEFSYTYHPNLTVNPHELHSADGHVYALPKGVTVFDANRVATPKGTMDLMEPVTRNKSIKQLASDIYINSVVKQLPEAEQAAYRRDTAKGQAMDIVRDVKFFQLQGQDTAGYRTAYGVEINLGPDAALALRGVAALVGQKQAVLDEVLSGTMPADYATTTLAALGTDKEKTAPLTPEQLHRLAVASKLLEKQIYGEATLRLERQEVVKERELLQYITPFYEIPTNTAARKALLAQQLKPTTLKQVQSLQREYTALNLSVLQETLHGLLTRFRSLEAASADKRTQRSDEALQRLDWLDRQLTTFWQRTNLVGSDDIKEAFVAESLLGPGAFVGASGRAQIDGFTIGLAQVSFMRYTKDGFVITGVTFDPSTYTYWSKALQSMWGIKR